MIDEDLFSALDAALETVIAPWKTLDAPLTLLFSGGIDSGLLAWELRRRSGLTLTTVGFRGSPDLRAAEEGAALLGLPWMPSEVTASDVREVAGRGVDDLVDLPRTSRSVLIALMLALDRARSRTAMCGQGADELFLGYAHFRGLDPAAAAERAEDDLRVLLERDWPRSQQLARKAGRRLIAPFLQPEFVAAARAIPLDRRLPRPLPKGFFREWAMRRGLPAEIARRPKRAFQYGSGVDRLLPREATIDSGRR